MDIKNSFHPYALITIFCWTIAYILTKLTLAYFSPLSLALLRYAVASIALLIVVIAGKIKPPKSKDIFWFVLSGIFGFFLYMVTFNTGAVSVTAATSSVIIATVPIITAFFARFIYKEQLKGYQWAAIAIEFLVILLLTLMGGAFSTNQGVLWLIVAAFLLSGYNLIQRRLTKEYSSIQVSAYSILIGTFFLLIFTKAAVQEIQTAPPIQILYIIIMGVFSSALAYVCWAKAFAKAEKTSMVSNYMFLTPLLTTVLGFLVIHEIPELPTIIGGIVIIFGVLLFNKENFIGQKKRQN